MEILAAAYAAAGQFTKAVEWTQITCAYAYLTGQNDLAAENGKLLGFYASGNVLVQVRPAALARRSPRIPRMRHPEEAGGVADFSR